MSTQFAKPPYFTWVLDKVLAISAVPFHHSHLNYLKFNKIETIVSFDNDKKVPFHTNPFIKVVRFSNNNLNLNDCLNFVNMMENAKKRGEGVLIHCEKGEERAALMALCYIVKLWQCRPDFAIDYYRCVRTSSLETKELVELVFQYYDQVKNTFNNLTHQNVRWNQRTEFLGNNFDMLMDHTIPDSYQQRVQF